MNMKKIIYLLLFILVSFAANSQTQPSGIPSPRSDSGFAQYNWVRALKGGIIFPERDTAFTPTYIGTVVFWRNTGIDSALWVYAKTTGRRWSKVVTLSGGVSAGTVTSIATNAATGITGGTITTSGTLALDTTIVSTRLWRQKGIDSVQYNLTSGLLLKVNVSDTALMLSPYLRKIDTAAMLSNYVPTFRNINTNSPLLGGGNLSTDRTLSADTGRNAAQLVTGGSLAAVKDSLVALIASSGGGTVLSVATTNDFGINSSVANATSTPNITIGVDTFAVSTRAWRQKGIDSVQNNLTSGLALKLNISDTAAMLATRLRITDTAAMLFPYLRNTDTSFMLSPYRRTSTKITNSDLVNSTISGIPLGSNLATLTFGQYLQVGASSYNGSTATTITTNGTPTNVGSSLVARDINGDFSARDISATLLGNASSASTVSITNDITTNATYYPMFSTLTSGNTSPRISSSKLTFNPSTGILTSTGFVGNLTGNASTATVLQTPRTINGVSFDGSANISISASVDSSLSAGYGIIGSPFNGSLGRTWVIDTSNISTKANVTGALASKVNISDTAAMLSNYVRYFGSTSRVDLGTYRMKADAFDLRIPSTSTDSIGRMRWNADDLTMNLGLTSSVVLQTGQEQLILVKNQTGTTIPNGTVVRQSGVVGASGRLKIEPFLANGVHNSNQVLGLTTEDIANGADGFVAYFGKVNGLNTAAYPDSTILYASSTVAGALTDTVPEAPNNIVKIGTVVKSASSNGIVFTRVVAGSNINQDEGVQLTNPLNNSLLVYDSLTTLWKDKTLVEIGAVRVQDTAAMLSKYFRTTTQLNDTTFVINRPDATADTIQLSFLVPDTTGKLSIIDTASMLAPYRRTSTLITNSDLTNSTISGIALGSNLNNLTAGNGLSGTAYNGGTAYTWQVDTSTISTKANVTGALVGYTTVGRFTDSLTNVQSRIQTKQPLGAYITFADSTTILAGRWLPNRSADSIAVIRALANSKGTGSVTSVATGVGLSGGTITTSGTISADTTTLSTRAYVTGQLVGYATTGNLALKLNISDTATMLSGYKTYYPRTAISAGTGISYNAATGVITNSSPSSGGTVTSVATNNGSGITGGTITSTGTLAIDTTIISTKANVTGLLTGYTTTAANALKLNISDTASMLSNYRRTTTKITNSDLVNSAITINSTSVALGGSINVGTVTSVTASAPLSSSGGTTPNITISQATTSTNGFLTSTDWNTFNNKASTASVDLKLNISDTAAMMSKSFRTTTQVNDTTFTINRPDGTKDTIALSVQVPSTSQLVYNTAVTTDADYSLGLSDTYVQLVSTSTPRTLTLPAASTCQGRVVILNSKVGGGSGWTLTQTIYTTYPSSGGVTSLNGTVDTIISNGTNWIFLSRY